jgi:hypothetical protein
MAGTRDRRLFKRVLRHLATYPDAALRTTEATASLLKTGVPDTVAALRRLEADGEVQRESAGALEAWRTKATPSRRKQAGQPNGRIHCVLEMPTLEMKANCGIAITREADAGCSRSGAPGDSVEAALAAVRARWDALQG